MRLVLFSMLICMTGCAPAEKTDFVSLFDRRTLTGWRPHTRFSGGQWDAAEGILRGGEDDNNTGGVLSTDRTFKDFMLELETKIDWPFDSGILLRVGPDGKGHQITLGYRPGGEIGALYCPWGMGLVAHAPKDYQCGDTPDTMTKFHKDGWNRIRITIQGEPAHIQFWLNNELVNDFTHSEETSKGMPPEGAICLHVQGGVEGAGGKKAYFRNIRVKPLNRGEKN